jgi:hypothetical protein
MAAPPGRNKRSATAKPKRSAAAKPVADGGPEEAASYIAEQVAGLARIARRHKHDTLGFLLDMALMEAEEIIGSRNKQDPP